MTQNKKIAITGGIGSGKTTVSNIIASLGYKVYSCDDIYSLLLGKGLSQKIGEIFKGVVDTNGNLNRKALSEIVFSDPQKLKVLRELTNIEVINYALKEMDKSGGLTFCEVPLLFENGFENLFDNVIVIQRQLQNRLTSVANRDNLTEEEIISRINSQFDYNNTDLTKYYVIHNDKDLRFLVDETQQIIKNILSNQN